MEKGMSGGLPNSGHCTIPLPSADVYTLQTGFYDSETMEKVGKTAVLTNTFTCIFSKYRGRPDRFPCDTRVKQKVLVKPVRSLPQIIEMLHSHHEKHKFPQGFAAACFPHLVNSDASFALAGYVLGIDQHIVIDFSHLR